MTKTTWWIIGIIIVIFGLFAWSAALQKSDPNTIARHGIHWHPELHIFVDGKEKPLPENIGLVGGHNPIHTHDEDAQKGVIHLEFDGRVKKEQILLGQFFKVWGKDMQTAFGTLTRMEVNGVENTEYAQYLLQEHDIVKLYYKTP